MRGTRLQPAVQRDEGSACRAMGHQQIVRGAGVQPAVPSLILIGWEGGIIIYTIIIYGTKKAKPYTEYRQPAVQMMIKTQTAQHKVPIESDKGEPKHENN